MKDFNICCLSIKRAQVEHVACGIVLILYNLQWHPLHQPNANSTVHCVLERQFYHILN